MTTILLYWFVFLYIISALIDAWVMYNVIILATVAMCGGGCALLWWLAL